MRQRASTITALSLAVFVLLTGFSWSAHIDTPAAGEGALAAAHAHTDAGDAVTDCDHCCHASAHLIALLPVPGTHELIAVAQRLPEAVDSVPQTEPDPPYTPPIV
ncbi:hypothetical protein [Algiphilus sp.]|uniref:hypothetical protein n=1 Tax=Algiphilus sp. TaxID=1872431 RepID=UPI0025C31D4B|nr:hypothetical protein [Algiphilus sp.]MCK5770418.1 hypothetical protein [Algiphilus sp.]